MNNEYKTNEQYILERGILTDCIKISGECAKIEVGTIRFFIKRNLVSKKIIPQILIMAENQKKKLNQINKASNSLTARKTALNNLINFLNQTYE